MKKKNKIFLKQLLIAIVTAIPLLFIHVYSLDQIKKLNSLKSDKTILLKNLEDELESSKVEIQKLSSEDVIISKAQKRLGLVKAGEKNVLHIDKTKIGVIENIIKHKYD